tara:strand:+ start:194 stop:1912 length:1719 start_codon:yes stop_codon:yes gene_type:complete
MPYIGNTIRSADDYRLIDDISSSFNGSTTTFALQVSGVAPVPFPKSPQQVLISVGGVIQKPDSTGASGFNLSGTNIVFSSAPSNGHAFFGIIYATADYLNAGGTFPDGSSSVPSVTFSSDTDTGLYRKASGTVGLVSDGSEVASFGTNGITADSFIGPATQVTLADESSDTTCFPLFATAATGDLAPKTGTNLTFNSATGILTATGFSGTFSGNVATASALQTARNIGGVSFDGTANINLPGVNTSGNQDTSGTAAISTNVTVADESSDTTCFPLFTTAATGDLPPKSGSNLTFNSSSGLLTATTFSGSGASLTSLNASNLGSGTIPDARFPATLPAISGANLTNLPAAGISNVVEDTSPQLGGNLDVLTREITTSTSNGDIVFTPDGTGIVKIKGAGSTDGTLQLNCSAQSHGVKLKSPAHSAGQSYTMILPDNAVTASKFLHVKSISGSGSTAVGQLEYADTFTGSITFEDAINETVFAITDANTVALDPDNGMVQTWTLGANRAATDNLTTGQSMLLIVTGTGSGYSLTWPTMTWRGGSAPTLGGSTPTAIELFKVGSTLYGANVGDLG